MIQELESKLDSFDSEERRAALSELISKTRTGEITFDQTGIEMNLHCHTFFSYNAYGFSPSKFAWLAAKRGLAFAGIVDFDVLDGLQEFTEAGRILELPVIVGIETRVFVPEFSDKEMTSPGEPGISYHMGVGFTSAKLNTEPAAFLNGLAQTAQKRNIDLMERVNEYLDPVILDYDNDVLPLTPAGNATERHLCTSYFRKASRFFSNENEAKNFWSQKLSIPVDSFELSENPAFLNLIRAKTMKRGGAGYVQPDKGAFPTMADMNKFVIAAGGIPTLTWLDGTSSGERQIKKLLEVSMASGTSAINIVPDRNFTPGLKDQKLNNLNEIVALAEQLSLPVVVGTEMNSPGQKFVDDFSSAELSPLMPVFTKGANIIYGHSVLQRQCELGYMSEWAKTYFPNRAERNSFFEEIGKRVRPENAELLNQFDEKTTPDRILNTIRIDGR